MEKPDWLKKTEKIFRPDRMEQISEYCRKNWPAETEHIFRTAEDVCCDRFLFDFTWDMERTWTPLQFEDGIDWSMIPYGDREFLWQFNRHRFLLCLGQAYQMSKDEKYALHYVRLMSDWIDRAREGDNIDLGPWRQGYGQRCGFGHCLWFQTVRQWIRLSWKKYTTLLRGTAGGWQKISCPTST